MEDDRLRQRLLMKASRKAPKGLDLATYRAAIDGAVEAGEFVDYRSASDYAQGIDDVVDSIEELLKEGYALEVIDLTEHALAAVEKAMGSVDDSDGHMGGILAHLQEIHCAACRKAKPDPGTLAKRLFEWQLRTEGDTFFDAAETYARVLGKEGLAVYRKLAEDEWARVPALQPGRDAPEKYGKRFRITAGESRSPDPPDAGEGLSPPAHVLGGAGGVDRACGQGFRAGAAASGRSGHTPYRRSREGASGAAGRL